MEFKKVLYSRRSTRSFTDRKVTREEALQLLDAAIHAPNACNMQSWHFFAVTDEATKKRLAENGCFAPWAASAPLLFIVCTDGEKIIERFGDKARDLFIIQDTSAAIQNILLTATDMGLGGCWMGSFNEQKLRDMLNIDPKYKVVAVVPIGEPDGDIAMRERKPLDEVVTHI